jgi:hypothetical protein
MTYEQFKQAKENNSRYAFLASEEDRSSTRAISLEDIKINGFVGAQDSNGNEVLSTFTIKDSSLSSNGINILANVTLKNVGDNVTMG